MFILITTSVLGCGLIGSSWIETFLAAGHLVRAWDPDPHILADLRLRFGTRINITDTPEQAVSGSTFIQESGPEIISLKRELLRRLQGHVEQRSILASSTSTLTPSELQDGLEFADRILVGHPFNPPHVIPLVEVVAGEHTDEHAVLAAIAFYRSLGKHAIRLHRERPGHLANRLQAALWREAVDAVASGQASVDDVDAAVTLALGPRWALMGPFATFNLGGGKGGLARFLSHLGGSFEVLWDDAHRPVMTEELKQRLILAMRHDPDATEELARDRDAKLKLILALADKRKPAGEAGE